MVSGENSPIPSDFFAVLVAGSNGFSNYRHQADVCYQYHLLTDDMGVPPSHIRVLMFDDVAWSLDNPMIGRLYNEPNGQNVYRGCNVDFRGENVSLTNFVEAISSLPTNINSTILVSYVDHGEPGALLFPNGDRLTGPGLQDVLGSKLPPHEKFLMYVEACDAGSVFENISNDVLKKKLIITASTGTQFSWATYCPTPVAPWADVVNGRHIGVCLADLFAVAWTRDLKLRMELAYDMTDTFEDHVDSVKNFVSPKSTVAVFGDTKLFYNKKLWGEIFPGKPGSYGTFNASPPRQNILREIQPLAHATCKVVVQRTPEQQQYYLL